MFHFISNIQTIIHLGKCSIAENHPYSKLNIRQKHIQGSFKTTATENDISYFYKLKKRLSVVTFGVLTHLKRDAYHSASSSFDIFLHMYKSVWVKRKVK